jgi:hypothetical protein
MSDVEGEEDEDAEMAAPAAIIYNDAGEVWATTPVLGEVE